jgi:2-aminoadipate transaminase
MAESWDGAFALTELTSKAVKALEQRGQRRGGGGGGGGRGRAVGGMAAQWEREKALAEAETTINLGIGMPAAESIPKQQLLASIERGAFAEEGDGASDKMWGYDGSQGYSTLREGMAKHFSAVRGVRATADHFLVDGGGGGAIATIAQTFLNPGDAVIAERPGYMGVMDSFVQQHAELAGVPLDDDGMKLDVLEATIDALNAAGHTPKLLYLQALFHNPRGQCYTRERMLGLIEICARKKLLILNDEACASIHLWLITLSHSLSG